MGAVRTRYCAENTGLGGDGMLTRMGSWINERWPLSRLIRLGLEEDIPGGSSYAYVFGSLLLFTFATQAATGIWQLFYYVPTVQHAYDSVSYLRTEIPFGWLIHGLHYWGANAMVILLLCHVIRVFIWGAYKRPRELTWVVGVGLFLVTLAMSFTGAPLPWDETGYWATEVGTSIAGTVPVIGNLTKQLMRGGESMGQLALSRMFILHVAIIPAGLLTLAGVHLVAFRQFGSVGPWGEAKRKRIGKFWPDQLFKDTLVCALLLMVLMALVVIVPPPFAGPADPLDTTFTPKPEWNFLFLYESLKFFPGKLEPVGTIGIPVLGIIVLMLLPFLDRKSERHPGRRWLALSLGALSVTGLVWLTLIGYYSKPGQERQVTESSGAAPTVPLGSAEPGKALFLAQGCTGCHKVSGSGGSVGPDLSAEGSKGRTRDWLRLQIRNPKAHNTSTVMPPFSTMTDQQLDRLVNYLLSLTAGNTQAGRITTSGRTATAVTAAVAAAQVPGRAAFTIGSTKHGAALFQRYCVACHGLQGIGQIANPGATSAMVPALRPIERGLYNLNPQLFAQNIDQKIQHGSVPTGLHPALRMPAFGDAYTLTQEEISDLEAYILSFNGVDRGEVMHPGVLPWTFLIAAAGALMLILVIVLCTFRLSRPIEP